jgi:subtilisin-like proprotein convertase family protein
LHNRTGGGQDDLVKTYDQNSSADIAAFAGQPTRGNWILRVTDLAGRDVGTLNRWGLKIGY